LAGVLLAAVVGAAHLAMPVGDDRISQTSCDKIKLGWTLEQVKETLDSDERDGKVAVNICSLDVSRPVVIWCDENCAEIRVVFEIEETGWFVRETKYMPSNLTAAESLMRRVVRRIRAAWPWS
jgi:hypothetical protein